YRLSRLSYAVARRVVKVPFVAMVNLVAGREVVPELIQDNFTAAKIVLSLQPLLQDETARQAMQTDLGQVAALLRTSSTSTAFRENAIDRVAGITLQMITDRTGGPAPYQAIAADNKPGKALKRNLQKPR
ncbi:MAG TPA: hypothetical protein VGD64_03340, partial [Acidisarcina sp.]